MVNKSRKLSVQEAVGPYTAVMDVSKFDDGSGGAGEFEPCRAIRFNKGGSYILHYAGNADEPIEQTYRDGDFEMSQIVKICDSLGSKVGRGSVYIYY